MAVNAGYAHLDEPAVPDGEPGGWSRAAIAIRFPAGRCRSPGHHRAEPKIAAFSVYITERRGRRGRAAHRAGRAAGRPRGRRIPDRAGDDPAGILPLVDVAVCGEGESVVRDVFATLLAGGAVASPVVAPPPDLAQVALPYRLYSDDDIAHRVVYAEATRGCPFRCEYCTSAGSGGVRAFPRETLLEAFGVLLDRGVRQFKFLDRSFNFGGRRR